MTDSTSLAVREISLPTWETIQAIAPSIKGSGLFGVPNQDAAASIMLKGYELGMSLTASFELIHIIEGKPSLSPRGALALVLQSPVCAGITIEPLDNPVGCRVTAKRKGGMAHTVSFTVDDAKRAGLLKPNSGWDKYPLQMAQWRAIGFALDVVFPDVIGGLKRSDELGAEISPSGEVIEGSWAPVSLNTPVAPITPTIVQNAQPDVAGGLMALAERFGAEAVLSANGGRMPATADELMAIAAALGAS